MREDGLIQGDGDHKGGLLGGKRPGPCEGSEGLDKGGFKGISG